MGKREKKMGIFAERRKKSKPNTRRNDENRRSTRDRVKGSERSGDGVITTSKTMATTTI